MIRKLIITSLIGIAMVSCLKDKTPEPVIEPPVAEGPCVADTISFSTEVLGEIMNASCNVMGCHDAATATAGYVLETHSQIETNANVLLSVLNHTGGFTPMPIGSPKLADSLIQKFECWIEQGKMDN